uniref:Gamma-aminobutyric acid type B receptor subunit n=1 Tax=Grandidierella japonica TaxID=429032 RepID=A0A4D6YRS4_GRAJA|nr:gamma-aminobutyric acid type B receptor subunit [Grandidierella japonica]
MARRWSAVVLATLPRMLLLVLVFLVSSGSSAMDIAVEDDERVLHIGGIFPINGTSGWQGGQACQPAAMLALADVNKNPDLLRGYRLNLVWNDSLCDPGLGAAVMYDLLYNAPKKLMLLGGCSIVSTTIGEAARMWNLIVVSFGSSSPALSDRKRFPTFFRTHPSATVHNPTRVELMKKFGWSRVAILQQTEEVFISTSEDLEQKCKDEGIEILTRQNFLSDPSEAVKNLKRQDARIVVGLFYVNQARRVLCEIYKNELYGKNHIWFFIGWYENGWHERNLESHNCTKEQMRKAAAGHLTTEAMMWNQDDVMTASGITAKQFKRRLDMDLINRGYDILGDEYPEGYQEAPLAYDAIWSMAVALNVTMEKLSEKNQSIHSFTYSNKEIADEIYNAMNATSFMGVSGRVAFGQDGSRIAWTKIEQLIDNTYEVIGYYDGQTKNLSWRGKEQWVGGKPPQDRTIIRSELKMVSMGLFISMCCISGLGILTSLILLCFTCCYKHRRMLRMSHPTCNNITLVGAMMCFISVWLLGLDGRYVRKDHFPYVCTARAWVLSVGFSLAYGSMFSKIWRVHRLTTKAKTESKAAVHVNPWKIYVIVSALVVVDIIVLSVWQGIDPMYRKLETFPFLKPADTDDDVRILPQLEHCDSNHNTIWLGVLYSFKGLLLIFGLFLSYETRSIKLDKINDSRLVGMSIYNVFVLCVITAPVTLLVSSQQNASFAFSSLAIIFCCFLSMALIFVPKIMDVVQNPNERVDSAEHSVPTREDEERYHKLMAENEDMQKAISEKEEKIKELRKKIADKRWCGDQLCSSDSSTRLRAGGCCRHMIRQDSTSSIIDPTLVDCIRANAYREAMEDGAAFIDVNWVASRITRSEDWVAGNWRRGYDFVADGQEKDGAGDSTSGAGGVPDGCGGGAREDESVNSVTRCH